NKTVNEDSGAQTFAGWATGISAGATNESGQVLTFHVSATDTSLFSSQPAVSTAGTLTFTPAADANGTTNVDVYLTDNGGTVGCSGACDTTATQTFSITITSVNDVPSFTKGANKTVNEDSGAQTFAGWATGISAGGGADEASQTLTFHVTATDTSLFSVQPDVSADGTLTFTPADNAFGTTTVEVYLTDDGGTVGTGDDTSATQTFTITIDAVNDLPVATAQSVSVDEDSHDNPITLAGTDVETAAGDLTFSVTLPPANGSLSGTAPDLAYTPDANYCGADAFSFKVHDGTAWSTVAAVVSITVDCFNDLPVATAQSVSVDEDSHDNPITLAGTDVETAAGDLTFSVTLPPANGSLSGTAPDLAYTPDANYCGADAFSFKVHDGTAWSTVAAVVSITVDCFNDLPVADSQDVTVDQNSTDNPITLTGSDVDTADTLVYGVTLPPSHGTLDGTAPDLTYTPDAGYFGDDAFSFTIGDGTGFSNTGTVSITVAKDLTGPVAFAPTIAFGSGRVDETAPLLISWPAATDAGVGVASYEVRVSIAGAAPVLVYAGTARSVTRFYAFGKTLVFSVRGVDNNGNKGSWVAAASRKLVAYQSAGITYVGTWPTVASSGSSGTGYRYTTTLAKSATLKFTGNAVLYVAAKMASAGYVRVYVDGHLLGRYNLKTASTTLGQIIARKVGLGAGLHTIKIVNDQAGRRTTLDAFIVLQ
ncbi:MAG: Ig-like domain-containing protein, partial [Chloroflexota bacterium]